MFKPNKNIEYITDKLKKGKIKLYFGEGCPACQDQLNKLNTSYGKIRKFKGAIDIKKHNNPNIQGVPTWVNKYGDHIVGSYEPNVLIKKLNTKQKRKRSFGKNNGFKTYTDVPQFINHTMYGGKRGGGLSCNSENINTWANNLQSFNKNQNPLGTFNYGGLLPRPYGPSDNINLQQIHLAGSKLHPLPLSWNYKLGQFGKTPGSKSWKLNNNKPLGSKWVKPKLAPAKGYNIDPILLGLPIKNIYKAPNFLNVPKQFSNNQYNNPQPSSLIKSNFGKGLIQMEGPNNVGYRNGLNLYPSAGANTINWTTNHSFRKQSPNFLKVKKTKNNPTSWISNVKNINKSARGFNKARSYTKKGIKFGNSQLVFTRDNLSGAKTLYQPTPPYMREKVIGDYANKNFGKRLKSKKKIIPKKIYKPKKLQTQFGGKTITLDKSGKITISANPNN